VVRRDGSGDERCEVQLTQTFGVSSLEKVLFHGTSAKPTHDYALPVSDSGNIIFRTITLCFMGVRQGIVL
jgi:hypothetical protein